MALITASFFSFSPVSNCSFKLHVLPILRGEYSFASFTHPTLCFRAKLGAVKKVTGAVEKQLGTPADQEDGGELKSASLVNAVEIKGIGIRAEEENSESHATVENASAEKKIAAAPSHKFRLSVIRETCCSFFLCLYVMIARIHEAFRYNNGMYW